jgi:hypothetical protein
LIKDKFQFDDDDKFFISMAKLLKLSAEIAPDKFIHQSHMALILQVPVVYVDRRMDNAERWCIRFFKKLFRNERGIGYRFSEAPSDAVIEQTKTLERVFSQMRSLLLSLKATEYNYQALKSENEALYELHLQNRMLATWIESTLLTHEKILRQLSNEAQAINRIQMIEAAKPDFWDDLD